MRISVAIVAACLSFIASQGALGQADTTRLPNHKRPLPDADDVKQIVSADTLIGGDERKRYVLIGPKKEAKQPKSGWRLLLVLPGGDGSPDFHPFIKRIYQNVLPDEFLLAQVVALEWSPEQAEKLVWPTKNNPWEGMKFSTEELVDAVIDDVKTRRTIDNRFIFILTWSSSGPAACAISLQEKSRVTGSFIAMSVFKPDQIPPLRHAKGHRYFILHSPQDFIPIRMAKQAEQSLKGNGAAVNLQTYQGGHGWRDDPFGKMRLGIEWLSSQAEE